jgi:SNF2 family DNA or RNA helicase
LKRLRKTAEESTNHAEPLILDISSDEDAQTSIKAPIVLDVSIGDDDDAMVLDEEDEEEEAGESSSEEVDAESITSLDNIIQQTENYTSRLRSRLAEMKIDDKKNSISQSEDALYERAPSCLLHKLKDYQLIGINWMYCLNQEGLNGILADESSHPHLPRRSSNSNPFYVSFFP